MKTKTFNIKALDALFFRDGKPFTMGQDITVDSVSFPPAPSVLFGMLRTTYITQKIEQFSLDELIKQSKHLSISKIALCLNDGVSEEVLFPIPKDLVVPKKNSKEKKNNENEVFPLEVSQKTAITASNYKLSESLIFRDNNKLKKGAFYLKSSDLEAYLDGDTTFINAIDINDYLLKEIKIGIGRENTTNIVRDGLLYRINMIRTRPKMKNNKDNQTAELSIIVELNGLDFNLTSNKIAQLGGERRIVSLDENRSPNISFPKISTNTFKLYLTTPAVFSKGWFSSTFLDKFNLEITSAAIDKPEHIGGWDIAKGKPKPMYKVVPAGAIYNIRAISGKENKINEAIDYIHSNKSISELGTASQGFGIAFIGKN